MIERIKQHFSKNKSRYIFLGIGLVIGAGVTWAMMSESEKDHLNGHTSCEKDHLNGHTRLINYGIIQDSVVSIVEREGRGHPGYLVRNPDTGEIYKSQKKAAEALGAHQSHISDHLNGRKDHVFGHRLERVEITE